MADVSHLIEFVSQFTQYLPGATARWGRIGRRRPTSSAAVGERNCASLRGGRLRSEMLEDRWLLSSGDKLERPPVIMLPESMFESPVIPEAGDLPESPFAPLVPAGSFAYLRQETAAIESAVASDTLVFRMEANQSVAVRVRSTSSLIPRVTLQGPPEDNELQSSTSPDSVLPALLPFRRTQAGDYSLVVSGVDGTTGTYAIDMLLNGVFEAEQSGGGDNSTPGTAESLEAFFSQVGDTAADQVTIVGFAPATFQTVYTANMDVDPGWDLEGGPGGWEFGPPQGIIGDPASAFTGANVVGYELTTRLDAVLPRLYATTPRINTADMGRIRLSYREWLNTLSGEAVIEANTPTGDWSQVWTTSLRGDTMWSLRTLELPGTISGHRDFMLRWGQGPVQDFSLGGWNIDDVEIAAEVPSSEDWYRFALDDRQSATVTLASHGDGRVLLELYDATGTTLLARGTGADVRHQSAHHFTDQTSNQLPDEMLVRVRAFNTAYSLVVTRDGELSNNDNRFIDQAQHVSPAVSGDIVVAGGLTLGAPFLSTEIEPNDDGSGSVFDADLSLANDLSNSLLAAETNRYTASVTGSITFGVDDDLDFFLIRAKPGDQITIDLRGASSNSGTLSDPYLWLLGGDGRVLATNDDANGTLDARIAYNQFTTEGEYYIVADKIGFLASGTYRLSVVLDTDGVIRDVSSNWYAIDLTAGDQVSLVLTTPGDDDGAPDNGLRPVMTLVLPDGTRVARGNSFQHVAAQGGVYHVRVTTNNLVTGSYLLHVSGLSGSTRPFAVASSNVASGIHSSVPHEVVITFNDDVNLSTLSASDVLFNGESPATIAIVDGRRIAFSTTEDLRQGINTITIAEGAILDLQNTPLEPFVSEFYFDSIPPKVVHVSVAPDEILPTGPLSLTIEFSESLVVERIDRSDVRLLSDRGIAIEPIAVRVDEEAFMLNIDYPNLADGRYRLLLRSRDTTFVDVAANRLDGESTSVPSGPSGDGIPGGDFVRDFVVDSNTVSLTPYMTPIVPSHVIGLEGRVPGYITSSTDLDRFTVDLTAGDLISVVLRPHSQLQANLSIFDPLAVAIAMVNAAGAGRHMIVPAFRAAQSGTYTIQVSGEAGSEGAFEVLLGHGVVYEPEEAAGSNNDTTTNATRLDELFVSLGSASSAERAVVRGISDASFQVIMNTASTWRYHHEVDAPETGWSTSYFDDMDWRVGVAEFGYGDGDEETLLETGPLGDPITVTSYFRQRISVERDPSRFTSLRTWLDYDDGAALYLNGTEFARENLSPDAGHSTPAFASSNEAVLTRTIPLADLPAGVLHSGLNVIAADVHQRGFSFSDFSYALRMDLVASSRPYDDWYQFSLRDGQSTSLWLEQLVGSVGSTGVMRLYAADGTTLLSTASAASGGARSIQGFVDTTTDGEATAYLVRVTGVNVQYNLVVTRDAIVEAEPNGLFRTAQWAPAAFGKIENRIEGTASVVTNFAGMNSHSTLCGCEPPDTHVAVGRNHVVEVVNTAVQVYDKQGNRIGAPKELTQFFQPSVVQGDLFDFDPVVAYDELADRWVVAALIAASGSADESDLLYAVSDSGDPSAGWLEQHRIDFSGVSPGLFADYPKIGWNADAHVITLNMFGPFSFDHVDAVVIGKTSVVDRDPATINSRIISRDENSFTLAAAVMHGAAPGDPMWFVEETEYGGGDTVRVVRLDDLLGGNPTFRDFEIPVATYELPPNATQPATSAFNTGDSRILNAAWRNNRLYATHTVGVNEQAVVRWYEFDTQPLQPALMQQVTMNGGLGVHRYYPAIDVNRGGDVGLTFLQSSSTEHVSMYVSGQSREAVDGSYDLPSLVRAGNEPYPGGRGGDYAGIGVDPITDTFWAANEVSLTGAPNPLWSTWIGEFVVTPINDEDWYWLPVNTGDHIQLSVTTTGRSELFPENKLIADLTLYSPSDVPIAMDLDRTEPGTVRSSFVASVAGNFRFRVSGWQNTAGSYVFSATGATATRPAPFVIDMDPDDGMTVAALPDRINLRFSEGFRNSTLNTAAFRIDGLTVASAQFVDPVTVALGLPTNLVRHNGVYLIDVLPGALIGVSGQPNSSFSGTITVDNQGPRIIGVTWNELPSAQVEFLPTDNLQLEMQFDEPLFALFSARRGLRTPGTDDITLTRLSTNTTYRPLSMNYDFASQTIRAEFPPFLPEGEYELRILSGDGAFEDLVGNDLDGESNDIDGGFPTGNGTAGGDFIASIALDIQSNHVRDFVAIEPLAVLAYEASRVGILQFSGDTDHFAVSMSSGESLAVRVTPDSPTALLVANGQTAAAPGASVVAWQTATTDGELTWGVSANENTGYRVEFMRNLVKGDLFPQPGNANRSDITASKLTVDNVARFAVQGDITPEYNDQLLITENFSNGLNGFTINNQAGSAIGLWHLSTGRRSDNLPLHSPPASLYFGRQETTTAGGNYDGGHVAGTVTSGEIAIPLDGESVLSFSHFLERESSILFDIAEVLVDDGTTRTPVLSTSLATLVNTDGAWRRVSANLDAYRGRTVRIVFSFDSVDDDVNNFEGWFVDDITIVNRVVQRLGLNQFYVDLQDYVGHQVDVVLHGQNGTSFFDEQLSLWGPNGVRLANAVAAPENNESDLYDLAILNQAITAAGAGLHYVTFRTSVGGEFTINITARSQLELEPNDTPSDGNRAVNTSTRIWAHADAGVDAADYVNVNLTARQPVVVTRHISSIDQEFIAQSGLETSWSDVDSNLQTLAWLYSSQGEDMVMSRMVTSETAGSFSLGIEATRGRGAYQWEFDFATRSGDVNEDGVLRCDDVDTLIRATRGRPATASADISGDGSVDRIDVNLWFALSAQTNLPFGQMYQPGDANLDGQVDARDFLVWETHRFSTDATWCSGDFNADSIVDVSDFNLWNANRFLAATGPDLAATHGQRRVPREAGDARGVVVSQVKTVAPPAAVRLSSDSGIRFDVDKSPESRAPANDHAMKSRPFFVRTSRHKSHNAMDSSANRGVDTVVTESPANSCASWRDRVDQVMGFE